LIHYCTVFAEALTQNTFLKVRKKIKQLNKPSPRVAEQKGLCGSKLFARSDCKDLKYAFPGLISFWQQGANFRYVVTSHRHCEDT